MTPQTAIKKAQKIFKEECENDPQKTNAILAIAKFLQEKEEKD